MGATVTFVFRGLFTDALACTRCGSETVFPAPGAFGALGDVLGLARHLCRRCGRPFWTKASAEYVSSEEPDPEGLAELLAAPADPVAFDLDIDVFRPAPEPVDLAALDAEFARRCAAAKRPSRRRRRRVEVAKA